MTVRLRPHHLLCMLTYVGKGYGPAFTASYDRIAGRISDGEAIELVAGPDDICAPVEATPGAHCRRPDIGVRDRLAAEALRELLAMPLAVGDRLDPDPALIARMRAAFAAGTTRRACAGCEWTELCDTVAGRGFTGTRLAAAAALSAR